MRFLADESCDFSVVRALRESGHDVLAVAEISPRATDEDVLRLAARSRRVLLTEDKDFGELVHVRLRRSSGVVFIRYPAAVRASLPGDISALMEKHADKLKNSFVVLEPGHVRVSRLP